MGLVNFGAGENNYWYAQVVKNLNEIAEAKKPRDRGASGADQVPLEAVKLITERAELSVRIADAEAGVRFVGWRR